MAKKIRIDFSKTEERSGWNTKHITEGLHKMKVESVKETEAGDGVAMLVFALVPESASLKTRRFPFYCKLQQNQLWKLRDLLVATGQTVPKKAAMINPDVAVGKFIAAEVEDDTYQGNLRSQVQGTYGLDILDEDGAADTEPDEDEEEYEDEADEAEEAEEADEEEYEEEEADEEDEEEEAEDLSVLPLAELRKRAKGLGVDTVGLKKAELIEAIEEEEAEAGEEEEELEDEDLEDEELADEEFEDDEEEEEEPAPKRRAPVRKAAPKAAPAKATAPAKRVVKRR